MEIFKMSLSKTKFKIFLCIILMVIVFLGVMIPDSDANPIPCHPEPVPTNTQYIIGYGSLMNEVSKRRTDPHVGDSIPIRVKGFQRIWNARGETKSLNKTTFLGINEEPGASLNAVLFKLPETGESVQEILGKYDYREEMYCRRRVKLDDIQFLVPGTEISPLSDVWIYVTIPGAKHLPTKEYPIAQTYADTFLTGCLDLQEKFKPDLNGFLDDCFKSTEGWSDSCVDNRDPEKAKSSRIQAIDLIYNAELPGKLPCPFKRNSSDGNRIHLQTLFLTLSLFVATLF